MAALPANSTHDSEDHVGNGWPIAASTVRDIDMIAPVTIAALTNGSPVRRQQIAASHDSCTVKNAQRMTDPIGCGRSSVNTKNARPMRPPYSPGVITFSLDVVGGTGDRSLQVDLDPAHDRRDYIVEGRPHQ